MIQPEHEHAPVPPNYHQERSTTMTKYQFMTVCLAASAALFTGVAIAQTPDPLPRSMVYLKTLNAAGGPVTVPGWFWMAQAGAPETTPPSQPPGRWVFITDNDTGALTIPGWFTLEQPYPPAPISDPPPPTPSPGNLTAIAMRSRGVGTAGQMQSLHSFAKHADDKSGVNLFMFASDPVNKIRRVDVIGHQMTLAACTPPAGPLPPVLACNLFWPKNKMISASNSLNSLELKATLGNSVIVRQQISVLTP